MAKYPVLVEIKDGKIVKTKVLGEVWKLLDNNQRLVDYVRKNLDASLKNKHR